MRKIYQHMGHKEFDAEKLRKDVSDKWGQGFNVRNKVDASLWGSPFNEYAAYTWEDFAKDELSSPARLAMKELVKVDPICAHFEDAADMRYALSDPWTLERVLSDYLEEQGLRLSDSVLDELSIRLPNLANQADNLEKEMLEKMRDNSFYFVVDESKILKVHDIEDIRPYFKEAEFGAYHIGGYLIDYDAMKAEGWCGLEVCSMDALHTYEPGYIMPKDSPLRLWDCQSISIWDPDVVTQIPKELACISRMSHEAHLETFQNTMTVYDAADPCMDVAYLTQWIQDNQEKVVEAVNLDIISQDDLIKVLGTEFTGRTMKDNEQEETQEIEEPILE